MHFKQAIGLDVLPGEMRLAYLGRRGASIRILATQSVRIPPDRLEAQQILQRVVQFNGWTGLPCVIGLRGDAAFLRVVAIPASDARPLAERVAEQLRQFKSLATGETVENYAILRSAGPTRNVLLGFARLDMLHARIEETEAAGLRVVGVTPAPMALFNALAATIPKRGAVTALIHPGPEGTDVVMATADAPLFFWRFATGMRDLSDPAGAPTVEAATARHWVNELLSGLRIFQNQMPEAGGRLQSLSLCMPPETFAALQEPLARLSRLAVRHVVRLRRLQPDINVERFVSAGGLALQALGREKIRFCLLPNPFRERIVLRWQLKYWIGAASAVVLALWIALDGLHRSIRHREREYRQLQIERDTLRALEQAWHKAERRNEALRKQLGPLQHSAENAMLLHELLIEISQACHPDDWITLISDAATYFSHGRSAQPNDRMPPIESLTLPDQAGKGTAMHHIVVEGYTPMVNFSSVRALIETLRQHPLIDAVDLLGDDVIAIDPDRESAWALPGIRRFALDLRIRVSSDPRIPPDRTQP